MISDVEYSGALKIFLSYSHNDKTLKERLLKHLSPMVRQGTIQHWDDQQLRAGQAKEEILKYFDDANIILCLISPDFISSDYCYMTEMKRAWERRELEGAEIIPILLKPVEWQETPFSLLQVIPRDHKPIAS